MQRLYPFRFHPLFRRYIWGGRKLASVFGKAIGNETDYAESWELVDHGTDQSSVAFGELQGMTLQQLVRDFGPDLLGAQHGQIHFPLLVKLLDANQLLSVQVHPNDLQAARLTPPDNGKTEVWYVLAAEPGSKIYAGLKRGVDRAMLERELSRGTCELCLHSFEPQVGDVVFIPAGTVHAIGAGLLIAEIQQSSDTTLRLFDWNRVGTDGKPRPLHIEKALDVIDYDRGPVEPIRVAVPQETKCDELVKSKYFDLRRWRMTKSLTMENQNQCRIWMVIDGKITIAGELSQQTLGPGQTIVFPAIWPEITVQVNEPATILEVTLP